MYDPLVNLELSQEHQRRMREQASTDRLLGTRNARRHSLRRCMRALGRVLGISGQARRVRRQARERERAPKRAA
jgi:hypothetical protein